MARKSPEWWPSLAQFHPLRAKAERMRWSIPMARLTERTGLDPTLLRRFERGGLNPPPAGFRERVYWALRLLILEHARRMVAILEAVDGADNPPPVAGLASERTDCNCPPGRCFAEEMNDIGQNSLSVCPRSPAVPSFLQRLEGIADAEVSAAIERAKKPQWADPRHRGMTEEERATFGARMQAAREAARARKAEAA